MGNPILQRNSAGDMVWVRNGYLGKASKYDLCQLDCKHYSQVPEGCQIRKALEKIERVHHVRVPVWECPQYEATK